MALATSPTLRAREDVVVASMRIFRMYGGPHSLERPSMFVGVACLMTPETRVYSER